MHDDFLHADDSRFEAFVDTEVESLMARARQANICLNCLTDRLIVEFVGALKRTGISVSDIMITVGEGLDSGKTVEDAPVTRAGHLH